MDYASLRKQNKSRALAVAALIMCVVLSTVMVFGRLAVYLPANERLMIPLTKANGVTRLTVGRRDAQEETQMAVPIRDGQLLAAMPNFLTAEHGFMAQDENTVWSTETDVEIFRISYDNEKGETTVRSSGGDKVLAPGTSNIYNFSLENTGNVSLDYTMTMEAYYSNEETPIPVVVRLVNNEESYLAGSPEAGAPVLELNQVEKSGVISAGYVDNYSLYWEWPYESGDDAYDTMLGNLATEEDISLTIVIKTTAECSEDHDAPGGEPSTPETGDTSHIELVFGLMVLSLAGILLILLLRRKENSNEKA